MTRHNLIHSMPHAQITYYIISYYYYYYLIKFIVYTEP